MLRTALIAMWVLTTPAAADLWTSQRPDPSTKPPDSRGPTTDASRLNGSTADGRAGMALSLTVVADPACSASVAVVEDAAAFARAHGDVSVRVLLTAPPRRSRETLRALAAMTQTGLHVAWIPAEVRRRAPAALPAVYMEDGRGRGVRAAGRPPLDALWRMVRPVSGP